jgi:hypothetical protein
MKTLFCRQKNTRPAPGPMGRDSLYQAPRFTRMVLIGFLLSVGLALGPSPSLSQPADTTSREGATAALKGPYEQQIKQIEAERLVFQRDLAKREEACLKRFFSASCLEDIRAEHLREMRGFDLRRESAMQAMRDIDAKARADERAARIRERDEKQRAAREKAAAGAPRS